MNTLQTLPKISRILCECSVNASWTFYKHFFEHFANTGLTFHEHFANPWRNALQTFCEHSANIPRTFHEHYTNTLEHCEHFWRLQEYFINTHRIVREYSANILCTLYEHCKHSVSTLWTYHEQFTNTRRTFHEYSPNTPRILSEQFTNILLTLWEYSMNASWRTFYEHYWNNLWTKNTRKFYKFIINYYNY